MRLSELTKAPIAIPAGVSGCDLSLGTYFTLTLNGSGLMAIINAPPDVTVFDVEVNHISGVLSYPANVRWVGGIAPQNLQTGKIHFLSFRRPQSTGADQWIGSYLPNC